MVRTWVPLLAALLGGGAIYYLTGRGGPSSPLPDDPDQLILYSLDGKRMIPPADLPEAQKTGEWLYTFPVLGKVEVTDRRQVREILTAMRQAIRYPPKPSSCFWPRHAIRAVKEGEIVDVVVCFECHTYSAHRGDQLLTPHTPGISSDPEPLFDKTLTDAGVPLARKAHE